LILLEKDSEGLSLLSSLKKKDMEIVVGYVDVIAEKKKLFVAITSEVTGFKVADVYV
jgi:hypothetical protein